MNRYVIHCFDEILGVIHINRFCHQMNGTYMNELHLHTTRRHQHHSHFNDNNLGIVGGVSLLDSLMPFCRIRCVCLRITDNLRLGSILTHGRGDTRILSNISWQMNGWTGCSEWPRRSIHYASYWYRMTLFHCLATTPSNGLHVTKT
jgi:hypothetical protein